jgi:hypothetical protein
MSLVLIIVASWLSFGVAVRAEAPTLEDSTQLQALDAIQGKPAPALVVEGRDPSDLRRLFSLL